MNSRYPLAVRAMRSWAWWKENPGEYGWPPVSATGWCMDRTPGAPVYGPRVPRFDPARLGPRVDALLDDLERRGPGGAQCAAVLRAEALSVAPQAEISEKLGYRSLRTFTRLLERGRKELDAALRQEGA